MASSRDVSRGALTHTTSAGRPGSWPKKAVQRNHASPLSVTSHAEGRHGLRLKVSAFISDVIRPLYVLDDRLLSVTGKICLGGRLVVSEISLSGQAVAAASYEDAFVSRKADR